MISSGISKTNAGGIPKEINWWILENIIKAFAKRIAGRISQEISGKLLPKKLQDECGKARKCRKTGVQWEISENIKKIIARGISKETSGTIPHKANRGNP